MIRSAVGWPEERRADGDVGAQHDLESVVRHFAEPRELSIKLLATCEEAHGNPFGAELRAWIRLFEAYELEVSDPASAELRMPSMRPTLRALIEQQGASWIADFIGCFTASTVVIQQDEMSYLASWHSTSGGQSKVFYFHPNDWGLWPTEGSLLARLYRLLQEEERERWEEDASIEAQVLLLEREARQEKLSPHLDPASLFPRVDWLVHALLGVGRDLGRELVRAAPLGQWKKERPLLEGAPHLATYWIWSHYLLDNQEALEDLLEVTAGESNGVFADARELVVALVDGKATRLGDRNNAAFAELKQKIEAAAPVGVFGEEALARRKRREEEAESRGGPEAAALSVLEARAQSEPRIAEALRLLDHLSRGGAHRPQATQSVPLDADAAMARLYELVDPRFRDLIEARVRRTALFADTHREASWGLLLAWAAVAEDLADFEALLEKAGTKNLGPRRMTELYRAYATFSDRRATEILALGATQWIDDVEDWIRMTPSEPVLRLLERDVLETHQMMAGLLERASFSGANWEVCVRVACAAGELRSTRAVKGLERAVDKQLGRIDDGTRAEVVRALYLAAGTSARAFLEKQAERKIAAIRYADPADVPLLEKDLACLLSGLLPAAPDDEHVIRQASELLGALVSTIERAGRRLQLEGTIAAAEAIVRGAALGEVRALSGRVAEVASLSAPDRGPAARKIEALAALARTVAADLSA